MKVLYIAGPYRAATPEGIKRNIAKAQIWAAASSQKGWFPLVPHNLSAGLELVGDDQYWLEATIEVMRRCDAVLIYGGWDRSKGTMGELVEAGRLRMPIYDMESLPDLTESEEREQGVSCFQTEPSISL